MIVPSDNGTDSRDVQFRVRFRERKLYLAHITEILIKPALNIHTAEAEIADGGFISFFAEIERHGEREFYPVELTFIHNNHREKRRDNEAFLPPASAR